MLYYIIKLPIKIALHIFCKSIFVNNKKLLYTKGPLLITANHPNSFLDAIIIGALFKKPVHFLARGDAFNSSFKRKILSSLNMIPIYRIRDGYQNLHLNKYAFDKSNAVLANNGIVLIFIEGICKHTHQLQPFKKGAARIAFTFWQKNKQLQVLPLAIQYSSLYNFAPTIQIQCTSLLQYNNLALPNTDEAKNYLQFNQIIYHQLNNLLQQKIATHFIKQKWIVIPAFFGKILNTPLLFFIKKKVYSKTKKTVFYHSVLFCALLFLYPVYVAAIFILTYKISNIKLAIVAIIAMPLLAWCTVQNKKNNE